jgi:nitrogen regulatory protein PII
MDSTKIKRTKKTAPNPSESVRKLKILVTVVNRSKAEFFMDFLSEFEVNFQTSVFAQGTARSETLYMLGLEDSDKSVIFSVIREDRAQEILQGLEDKFATIKKGKGIAFTMPVSSVIGVAIYRFLSNHTSAQSPKTKE